MPPPAVDATHTLHGLDEALAFMRALWYVEHALERTSKRMEDTIGVSGCQRFALRMIGVMPDIGPAQLAAALHLHASTVTGVIQRLESRGLIRRVRHAHDGRRVHLRVTRAGARLNAPSEPGTLEDAVRTILRRTRRTRVDSAIHVLNQLAGDLIRHHETPPVRRRRTLHRASARES